MRTCVDARVRIGNEKLGMSQESAELTRPPERDLHHGTKRSLRAAMTSTTLRARRSQTSLNQVDPSVEPRNPPNATVPTAGSKWVGTDCRPAITPRRPEIELMRTNGAVIAAASRAVIHCERMRTGVKNMPPPVPVSPARRPRTAPVTKRTKGEGDGLVIPVSEGFPTSIRTAAANRTTATSGRYTLRDTGTNPPMNARGAEPASRNNRNNQRGRTRLKRTVAMVATNTLSTSAVGRISSGAKPRMAIQAR
jgi:hypothetical protein